MVDAHALNRRYETIAWGVFFIVFGIVNLVRGLPEGVGAVGIGIILLGLNLARYMSHIPTSGFTTTLGIISLVLGGVDLVKALFSPALELPTFPILLIILGVIWLARGVVRSSES